MFNGHINYHYTNTINRNHRNDESTIYRSAQDFSNFHLVYPISIPESKPHIFTKLQIRRAMRKLGVEDTLDSALSVSGIFAADWQDAQNIDLNDPIFSQAISSIGVDENFLETVINNIE